MSFEAQSNTYIQELISQNEIIEGRLIGVNESLSSSTAICSFLVNNEVLEKHIIIYYTTGMTWNFLKPTDLAAVNYVEGDWNHPEYAKRIIAPIDLVMDNIGPKFFGWFQLKGLPVVVKNNDVYLYCNVILPQHQPILESLTGVTVEDRP